MKHTPGPWKEHEGFIIGRFNSDNEIHDICDPRCAPPDANTICEMNANARLIAAAPELLSALQDLLETTIPTFDNRHEIASAICAIDEAIGDTDWRKGWTNLADEDEELEEDDDEDEVEGEQL